MEVSKTTISKDNEQKCTSFIGGRTTLSSPKVSMVSIVPRSKEEFETYNQLNSEKISRKEIATSLGKGKVVEPETE
jgi:hypothetical protein